MAIAVSWPVLTQLTLLGYVCNMIATNPIPDVCNYAQCGEKCAPTPEQAATGLVPLSTIPAQRWNSLWNAANQSVNCLKSAAGALIDEINSVLTATGITPDPTRTDQLYQAIDCIRVALGTDQVAGSVKSSSAAGQVSIDTNGIMTVNRVGNATQLTTSCKELTGAVNELKTTYDNAFTQVWGNAVWITDCRADVCHSSDVLTYGGGTSILYGHVKLSDTYDSCVGNAASSVAASQLTLYCLMQAVENMSGLSNCAACPVNQYAQTGTAGVSPQAARSDHVHYLYTDTYFPYTATKSVKRAGTQLVDYTGCMPYVSPYVGLAPGGFGNSADGQYGIQQYAMWTLCKYQCYYRECCCMVRAHFLKGSFRGCDINDFLTDWLMDMCWNGHCYCCWDCAYQRFGVPRGCNVAMKCCCREGWGEPAYPWFDRYGPTPQASFMGSQYLIRNCTTTVGAGARFHPDYFTYAGSWAYVNPDYLHLVTSAFQLDLYDPNRGNIRACTQYAHALILMENDARIPGCSTLSYTNPSTHGLVQQENGCLYLMSLAPEGLYGYAESCVRARINDVNQLLAAAGPVCACYYYGSYIIYGITANCVNIGVKNQTLYMRNA